jgi:Phosphoinositide phospholipase C, Ca2+-dependent
MPDYDALPYCDVSFKCAHNSYQRDETIIEQIQWDPARPWEAGCRGVELDISQSSAGNDWSVGHKKSYDRNYRQLSQFLNELRVWSEKTPGHDVITLHLDLKHVTPGFPPRLDEYVADYLGVGKMTALYTPGELMGTSPTLSAGAQANGWPTLGALRGKFLVCVTGDRTAKATYAAMEPKARLCFADKDCGQDEEPRADDRVFFNYHLFSAKWKTWAPIFREAAGKPNVVIRGWELNGETLWNRALDAGCHLLATNKVKRHTWAKVGDAPFVKLKPLG